MLRLATGLLVMLIAATLALTSESEDRAALQGKWRAIEATSNGEPPPPGMLASLTLAFSGEMVSIMGAPPTRYTLDTKFSPPHIDFLNSRRQVGIYELKGDSLKLCIGMDGDRPTSFHTEKYTDHTYMLLQRVKK